MARMNLRKPNQIFSTTVALGSGDFAFTIMDNGLFLECSYTPLGATIHIHEGQKDECNCASKTPVNLSFMKPLILKD
jgi:hypothetical protein